jgi:hypothetical protein
MATIKFKIEVDHPNALAYVNIIQYENDNYWEIKRPNVEVAVEISSGESRYAFINVLAPSGTIFRFYKEGSVIFSDKTDQNNAFGDYIIVHA